jgi:alanyl-tRNA synthetase
MTVHEIRKKFLEFFREKNHKIIDSDSLVPKDDSSLLFTGAGMNQFKDAFYGRGDGSLKRAATCQKCLRTGDIERVGHTASHHTFFEMLGNFSFGDYFKEETITWAWEFMREKLDVPAEKMVVSIYEDDEEAYEVWRNRVGLPAEKIYRFGEDENFWPANVRTEGPSGPCGPCSEIFYDKGKQSGCGRPECDPSCDCDRYVEVWNLVFQQFDRQDDGSLHPLPTKNIDTGMGLERTARVIQGVETNFDIDSFRPLMDCISRICGKPYSSQNKDAPLMRRIADHARAVVFCMADGVVPSNEEHGYVVRRLIRRAVRDGVQMGVEEPFLTQTIDPIVQTYGSIYPELEESKSHIKTLMEQEEKAFHKTVTRGSAVLSEHIAKLKRQKGSVLRGKEVFDLYQTYGFPVEMTESILKEHGMSTDVQGFLRELENHQSLSKQKSAFEKNVFAEGPIENLQEEYEPTEFTGYKTLESEARIIGIIKDKDLVKTVSAGDEAGVVLDRTPAYGESGGQEGDKGTIETLGSNSRLNYDDVTQEKGYFIHKCRVETGSVSVGERVVCRVDKDHRLATARNHTATHLLHYALRNVLGEHAQQSGSAVSARRLRFDFSNPTDLSLEEVEEIEDIVNQKILANDPVVATHMSRSEAQEIGATALFGEKYGDIVRVISIGDYSRELCGGTHCERTGDIGLFKITAESSVAGGVRRIEAVTGFNSLQRLRDKERLIRHICDSLNTQENNLIKRVEDQKKKIRDLTNDLQEARKDAVRKMVSGGSLLDDAEEIAGVKVIFKELDGGHPELRSAADALRKNNDNMACVFVSRLADDKVALVAGVSDNLVNRGISAKKLACTAASLLGGGGGGRDDLAQAGGSKPDKIEEALEAARTEIKRALEG